MRPRKSTQSGGDPLTQKAPAQDPFFFPDQAHAQGSVSGAYYPVLFVNNYELFAIADGFAPMCVQQYIGIVRSRIPFCDSAVQPGIYIIFMKSVGCHQKGCTLHCLLTGPKRGPLRQPEPPPTEGVALLPPLHHAQRVRPITLFASAFVSVMLLTPAGQAPLLFISKKIC